MHTLNKLHLNIGHISHAVIKLSVEQKIILGLELDAKLNSTFYTTCVKQGPLGNQLPKSELSHFSCSMRQDSLRCLGTCDATSHDGKSYYVGLTDDQIRWR